MKTPDQVWESMEIQMDRGIGQNFAQRQIEATLVLAEQTKRIADILDSAMEVDPENPSAGRYVWVRVREE